MSAKKTSPKSAKASPSEAESPGKPAPASAKKRAAPPVGWSARTRAELHVFGAPHQADPEGAHALIEPGAAWELLRTSAAAARIRGSGRLAASVARLETEIASPLAPAFDPSFELVRAACVAGTAGSAREWTEWAGWAPERALMSLWSRGSMPEILELLLGTSDFWIATGSVWEGGKDILTLELRDAPSPYDSPDAPTFRLRDTFAAPRFGLWFALRRHVDALDEAGFATANAAARARRESLPERDSFARAAIAYAFARDPEHARAEARSPEHWGTEATLVLLALPSFAEAGQLAERVVSEGYSVGELACDLVARFGSEVAPVLDRAIAAQHARKTTVAMRKAALAPLEAARAILG